MNEAAWAGAASEKAPWHLWVVAPSMPCRSEASSSQASTTSPRAPRSCCRTAGGWSSRAW